MVAARPKPFADEMLPLWYNALDEEIGIFIKVDPKDRAKLVNTLYDAKQRTGDPELEVLMLLQPAQDLIYIAKKTTEVE